MPPRVVGDVRVHHWVKQPCFPLCLGRRIPQAGDTLVVNGLTFHVDRTFRCCAFDLGRCHKGYHFSDQQGTED